MFAPLTDAEIAARIRAGSRCQVCPEQRRPGAQLCDEHCDALARVLDPCYVGDRDRERAASIPRLYARLDPMPGATGWADRRAPGFGSAPPCLLDPLVMRDERSAAGVVVPIWFDPHPSGHGDDVARPHYEDTRPLRSVQRTLVGVVHRVWTSCGYQGPRVDRDVEYWSAWLHDHHAHLIAFEWASWAYVELIGLHDQLRPVAGDPKPEPSAFCTGWVCDPRTREKVECKAPLFAPPPNPGVERGPARPLPEPDPNRVVIRCGRCDRPYSLLMLLRQRVGAQAA